MSCNPAIWWDSQGHLCREVDALGDHGRITDAVGFSFRLLTLRAARPVWFRGRMRQAGLPGKMRQGLESQPNLKIKQAEVVN